MKYDKALGKMITAVIRNFLAAGATALTFFATMDANPTLYIHDKFFVNEKKLCKFFEGKTMWITGASSGIGATLATQLSRHGANLILSARPSEKLDSVAESCRQVSNNENKIHVIPFDMASSHDEIESAVDSALKIVKNNNLDFVVLNAGIGQLKPATMTSHLVTEEIFKLNTLAPIALTRILLQRGALQKDGGKHLVVTSSVGGKFALPLSASYAASKHALHGYYDSLKAECPWLRIDLICPGTVDTHFHKKDDGKSTEKNVVASANNKPKEIRELKMSVDRCATLFISSLLMKKGGERWVAEQPTLLALYIRQFFPSLFERTLRTVGPLRVKAWEEGKNLYDPDTWKRFGRSDK